MVVGVGCAAYLGVVCGYDVPVGLGECVELHIGQRGAGCTPHSWLVLSKYLVCGLFSARCSS